jgi:hypothetical protein
MNFGWYTARHDQLVNVICKAVTKYVADDVRSEITLGWRCKKMALQKNYKPRDQAWSSGDESMNKEGAG